MNSIQYAKTVTSQAFLDACLSLQSELGTFTVIRNDQFGSNSLICSELPADAHWPHEFSNCMSPQWWNANGSGQIHNPIPEDKVAQMIGVDLADFQEGRAAFRAERAAVHQHLLNQKIERREAGLNCLEKSGFTFQRKSWRKNGIFIYESSNPGFFNVKNTITNLPVQTFSGEELASFLDSISEQ